MDRRLAAIAGTQFGVVAAEQARSCGYSADEIRSLRSSGEWKALRRGIYRPGAVPDGPRQLHLKQVAAALLALRRRDAVVAHVSGGVLWDLDWAVEPDLSRVWVTCPETGKVRNYPGLHVLPAQLPANQMTLGPGGLPACTPARVVVDLARHRPFREAVVLADSAIRQGLTTTAELESVLATCRGWPYARRAARAIAVADGDVESVAESLARAVFAEAGLPTPRTQVDIHDRRRRPIGRVDFHFAELGVIVEVDGRLKYADPEALWREKRREDRLREMGHQVVRLIWSDVTGPPEPVRARILAAAARAARNPPRASLGGVWAHPLRAAGEAPVSRVKLHLDE
jgi:very-short-patch-repair endonuclease